MAKNSFRNWSNLLPLSAFRKNRILHSSLTSSSATRPSKTNQNSIERNLTWPTVPFDLLRKIQSRDHPWTDQTLEDSDASDGTAANCPRWRPDGRLRVSSRLRRNGYVGYGRYGRNGHARNGYERRGCPPATRAVKASRSSSLWSTNANDAGSNGKMIICMRFHFNHLI